MPLGRLGRFVLLYHLWKSALTLGVTVFVTGNAWKLDEVREILAQGEAIDIESRDLDWNDAGDSHRKCRRAAEIVGGPVITEDTALCFAAMNGLPALTIKFFLRELGFEGINRMLDSFTTRAAWALCTFAYSTGPGTEPVLFEGRTDGRIVPPRGTLKFGWGPVFETEDNGLTYTEMDATQKHAVSHRGRALQKLRAHLLAQGGGVGTHDPSGFQYPSQPKARCI
ncbi:inosine triphosphate pyrophosphatase-like protein [Lactarius hengduanensis]|nr:inosine triphosphate pyrophosphatase-like protein [Lactarius hengduanensis]